MGNETSGAGVELVFLIPREVCMRARASTMSQTRLLLQSTSGELANMTLTMVALDKTRIRISPSNCHRPSTRVEAWLSTRPF